MPGTDLIHAYRNIEIERADVRASTIHALFNFDGEYKTKIGFTKQVQSVAELMWMEVLLLDEVSMIDDECFAGICEVLSIIDHSRRPNAREADCFGPLHLILFGDFKQELSLLILFQGYFSRASIRPSACFLVKGPLNTKLFE